MKLLTIKIGTEEIQVDPELYREFCLSFYNDDGYNGFVNKDYFYTYLNTLQKPYFLTLDPLFQHNPNFIIWLKQRNINTVIEKVLA